MNKLIVIATLLLTLLVSTPQQGQIMGVSIDRVSHNIPAPSASWLDDLAEWLVGKCSNCGGWL